MGIGRDLTEIAAMFIGVALVALLISRSSDTTAIITAGGNTFNGLLRTVTLQSSYGNPLGG